MIFFLSEIRSTTSSRPPFHLFFEKLQHLYHKHILIGWPSISKMVHNYNRSLKWFGGILFLIPTTDQLQFCLTHQSIGHPGENLSQAPSYSVLNVFLYTLTKVDTFIRRPEAFSMYSEPFVSYDAKLAKKTDCGSPIMSSYWLTLSMTIVADWRKGFEWWKRCLRSNN